MSDIGILTLDFSVIVRLLAAALAGVALGLPRNLSDKPIGMRTLGLVSLGAAMVSIAALRYPALAGDPNAASRVLQGIIQGLMVGVGFIGAGVILRDMNKNKVHGLTTATTVWIAAGLGIACGLADWLVASFGLVLALIILIVLKRFERHVTDDVEQH
ncbi:MAG: putative Mg2+ transporter-C (MgtC) family protein [Hyphomicrobiales bacterium]|jgi:putative Mg2+ transporter-C (MgtC) family protein|nr:putative Mg2+ transporter-C (MgtC) family protein [Hyphomicrobiales bacterium]